MRLTSYRRWGLGVLATLALLAAACGNDADDDTAVADDEAAPADDEVAPDDDPVRVAFFGFAAANAFAQATFSGIEEAAGEQGAEVVFRDPNFDSDTQISQIQDAITTGDFDAFIVQANDGQAVIPVIREALDAGIVVVGEFTPIGSDFETIEPQVEGLIFVGASPVENGRDLGRLGLEACDELDADPCKVSYLEGFRDLPLDVARTDAVLEVLNEADDVEVVPTVEGGYTPESGLGAAQDVLTATPDVDVMIGSTQAIMGAEQAVNDAGRAGEVALIGNGGARQGVAAVKEGRWFAVFADAEKDAGATALELAVRAVRGEDVPAAFDTTELLPTPLGTAENLPDDFEGQWDA